MRRLLLPLLAATALASAQSYFNMHGLGELVPVNDAAAAALGSPTALSSSNPGSYVELPGTALNLSVLGAATVGTESSWTRILGSGRPSLFYGAIPLPTRTRLLLGADTRFVQDFDVWSDTALDSLYRYHVTGRGGIYALRVGIAQSFLSHFCVGVEYNRLIGGSREHWRFLTGDGRYSSTDTIEMDYAGSALRAGLSLRFPRVEVGATLDQPLDLAASRYRRVHGVVQDSVRTYRLDLPYAVSAAASIAPLAKTRIVAGADYRPWSAAARDDTLLYYRDVWRLSGGVEYELFKGYPLRAGYSQGNWYCQGAYLATMGENPIAEQTVSIGTSVPVPRFGGLDISAEVSFRSSRTNAGPISETAGRLTLTLAYSEHWHKRTRRWGY